ncbi:dirigent protein 19-like [Cucurbita moschata]|uniref:Dirigent protein n=1 Tax=Cucurbita moschata TaxID=3662 RepID=A0A6J1EB83_CUCMO|nr:dirigent protein 19-like [Cucurbita moschata]
MPQSIHLSPAIINTMAPPPPPPSLILSSLFTLILSSLLSSPALAEPNAAHHPHRHLRSLHFSLFQHETINKTGYFIVPGVAGPGVSQTTTPFGTMFVFHDPLTTAPDRASKLVGTSEGTSITSSLDGLRSLSIAKISLRLRNHTGSLSIVGGTHNVKPSNHPIVGGTGDFLFVQGYVTSSPVDLIGITVVYKLEFHIYWPPYA